MAKRSGRSLFEYLKSLGTIASVSMATFVEMEGFSDDWRDLELTDDDL
jgi:hypothetical protein